ncbi:hypothetical protein DMC30DRAFT_417681 [Rhodotorula diobovata]|uniref:CinA C-terminal domain-containing protein n=1 Tax=Rhodotorula diobovata TaxID=5288 RepID=A0A5C5FTU4_9BASI|nr:hypothetical protein DMC30DRAFT_417681 [Rhodotorula diobovata]
MAFPPPRLLELAEQVVTRLRARKETLSLVETAAGGLVSSAILSVPGTSGVFAGSVVAYQLGARERWLGWTDDDTASYDGPTEAICLKLASSCRSQLSSTYCVAESGCAGPGRPDKYRAEVDGPGYCALGLVGEGGTSKGRTVRVPQRRGGEEGAGAGARAENMVKFGEAMLELLLEELEHRDLDGR